MRPSWIEYFMEAARLAASRSTCIRRHVGAVAVRDNRIIATGYNGVPSGLEHCTETTCVRTKHHIPSGTCHELCRGCHAEQNVIIQCAKYGVSITGAVIYCTHMPCAACMKMLINCGAASVCYSEGYPDSLTKELSRQAHIPLVHFAGVQNVL